MASKLFYTTAMSIMRRKFSGNVVFVVATDDVDWCRRAFRDDIVNVGDVFFTSDASTRISKVQPTFDLAVMAQCNHSIIRQV